MKKKLFVASLCCVLVLATGCEKTPKLQDGKEVVATIDGKTVTAEELYAEMRDQYGTGVLVNIIDEFIANKEIETDDEAKSYAESQLKSIKQQYTSAGQDFATALVNAGYKNEDAYKEAIILNYKQNKVAENYVKNNITEDEINEYYEKNIYGELTVKHILIKPVTSDDVDEDTAEANALEKAKEVIQKLQDGADWASLVSEYSDDTASVDNEGLIADFSKDEVVEEFWDASLALQDGEYTTEPVKSKYGYHIILRVSQKEKPSLEDVKQDILEDITDEKFDDDSNLSQKAWAEVRKSYNLDIVDTDIKSIYDSTISSLD